MRAVYLALALLSILACSKPKPPTLMPKRAVVTDISPAGIEVNLTLTANNPNGVDITAGDVSAHIAIDKTVEVGTATVQESVTLPANKSTDFDVKVSVPWANVVSLMSIALSNRRVIPYTVDGTLKLEGLDVDVPFMIAGNLTHDQIARAAYSSIPGVDPSSFPAPPPGAPPASAAPPAPNAPPGAQPRRPPHILH